MFAEHRGNVRRQLARMVPEAEVEDLLQEVFEKAARALPNFRGQASAATWLHRIAERAALDHLRSRRHHEARKTTALTPSDTDGTAPAGLIEPATALTRLERREMHDCIREYVHRLSPAYRRVIELKDLSDLTNAEIAARLHISLGVAKIRLHRARAALRRLLADGCEFYCTGDSTLACDRKTMTVRKSR
jgi:RNA polymerase sigma-70 factor (ECF subfamily)